MILSLLRMLMLTLMLSPAIAQQDNDQTSGDEAPAEADAAALQVLRDSAGSLEAQLGALTEQVGSFDVSLAEIQLDLGRIYLQLEEFELASEILTQALQLLRINGGLYDARQIRVLEQLVDSYKFKSEWDEVDDYQHLVFSLQRRHYKEDSPEFADAALSMGEWQLMASRANVSGRPGTFQAVQSLEDTQEMYAAAIGHAQSRSDVLRQWQLTYASALIDAEMARHLLDPGMSEMMITAPRYITQTVCRTVADASGGAQRVCWPETVNNPDYYYQANIQRRIQLERLNQQERARLNLQRAEQVLNDLLVANPAFATEQSALTQANLKSLSDISDELMRQSGRTSFGVW
jgi:tetratricopeptide (TPR) repeat protein